MVQGAVREPADAINAEGKERWEMSVRGENVDDLRADAIFKALQGATAEDVVRKKHNGSDQPLSDKEVSSITGSVTPTRPPQSAKASPVWGLRVLRVDALSRNQRVPSVSTSSVAAPISVTLVESTPVVGISACSALVVEDDPYEILSPPKPIPSAVQVTTGPVVVFSRSCPPPLVTLTPQPKLSFEAARSRDKGCQVQDQGSSLIFPKILKAMEEEPSVQEEPLVCVT